LGNAGRKLSAMNLPAPSTASQNTESSRLLRAQLLLHFQKTQNADGGWPFLSGECHSDGESRVEPTCWALRALADSSENSTTHIARAAEFLKTQQLSDGSWPATSGMGSGGWMTSLACGVLAQFPGNEKVVEAGVEWLCDDYPRDSGPWQKFLKNFQSSKHVAHNDEFRGWGWTPRTASWVEPTAFALMAFAAASASAHTAQLAKSIADRRALAIGLLYDRICAGGGWNCGNPRVYGVDGDSLVLPTCWALLALRDAPEHPNRSLSLAWLQKSFAAIASPGSLAIAQITLENYGVPVPALQRQLSTQRQLTDWCAADLAGQGTHVAAWVALALSPSRSWSTQSQLEASGGPQ
jgi:hypothetical protein